MAREPELMETVAFRAKGRQRKWLDAEARRRKTDRSELLRALVDGAIEEAKLKRERARQAIEAMREAGADAAEIERRMREGVDAVIARGAAALAEKMGVDRAR